ncbi:hypothetical protein A2641_01100 [Candidatus Nomurabacteria bacterium RIFCSPHIGHO2_01_FULL_37_25]|uniref:Right handed beta helix domain-containing protein n=1 Tax=Candidatus Nomurabacteria bacterium RIFCSPLOWO2_01_FULL_36_16 TaxID=1801767 RepID=A0A1F6WYX0_9BACT|nr:MAG: hypothetical protein A2641_01100 [Candidatus Nomurabacteria bacterium RIFCSPHIGHO2_01_FULL_37_25]OGI75316.1 MAG: hypothetical protein A3D36_02000 [Candidatus Nomurabacteria bacterium RIFCSPHIGHO2_02_FULL_36_29]OGI87063.1 MAG: hypothetical protein A3A91_00095 [Candidatus Nomurabacteria bacterium RIFCSPLOWO2_01_FULL_36_16]
MYMKQNIVFLGALMGVLVASVFLFATPAQALHPALPCDIDLPGECQITTLHNMGAGGVFSVSKTLHLVGSSAQIKTDPGTTLEIDITGDLIMDIDSKITGDANTASGIGATTNITVSGDVLLKGDGASGATISMNQSAGSCSGGQGGIVNILSTDGDITIQNGAKITVDAKCPAGEIELKAPKGIITIDGLVSSESKNTGTGAIQRPGGGPITIVSGCDLTVGLTGIARSEGRDPGADLVHLEGGCDVLILGLVESTGQAHTIPNSPVNHCNNVNRPDKPSNSTACVEIWSGDTLIINAFDANNGEVNADTAQNGGHQIAWIDLFSKNNISIIGDITGDYAVHANEFVTNAQGGIITVKSVDGSVTASGLAIQANATSNGGSGGDVIIQAGGVGAPLGNVDFGASSIQARGSGAGAIPSGGDINVRSFKGALLGTVGGELNASGGNPANGLVTLQSCIGTIYTGTATPSATVNPDDCAGAVSLPIYVILPICFCSTTPSADCPICELDGAGQPVTVIVDQNVTLDFNSAIPSCAGDADLCAFFTYDISGPTPDTWKAIFNLGGKRLLVKSGATITTSQVPPVGNNNRMAPGIEIRTSCKIFIEEGALIIVESHNGKAGDIIIHADGEITINGEITNRVTGTVGLPGDITISSCCGDIVTGPKSLIQTIGNDRGGSDITITSCCKKGDIILNGLVLARAKAHSPGAPKPDIRVVSFSGSVTINADTSEPLFDEYNVFGDTYDLWPGLLSWVTHHTVPGSVSVQALKDVKVYGHGDDPTAPVRKSFAAVAAGTGTSNSHGGVIDARAIEGDIIGRDRAFESFGVDNSDALIRLWAGGDIDLAKLGANNSFGPVVDSMGNKKGGTNELRAFQGNILVGLNTLIDASGLFPGVNLLTSCAGVTSSGILNPLDANGADDSGVCGQVFPALLFADCKALGVKEP